MNQMTVSVTAPDRVNLVKALRSAADNLDGTPAEKDGELAESATKRRKTKPVVEEDQEVETASDDEAEDQEMETAEPDDEAEEDFTAPPAKAAKAKKFTVADVNDACKARAKAGGAKGRAQVLSILKKKFQTESISEIDAKDYGAVIKAMQA